MTVPTKLSYLKDNAISSSSLLSSSDTGAGYSLASLISGDVWDVWRSSTVTGSQEILMSFSATQTINFLGIAKHNLSSAGTFSLKYGSTSACADGESSLTMTDNNFGYFASNDLTYKYFKLSMNESISDGYMEIGELEMGQCIVANYNPVIPIPMVNEMEVETLQTPGGQKWQYRKYHRKGWSFSWIEDLTREIYASLEALWEDKGQDIPFFLCPQPHTHPEDVLFVRIESFDFGVGARDSRPGTITVEEVS